MINSGWEGKALKQSTFSLKKRSAGRNSSGRITVFHRGGGSKRLQREIDFKRNTSSMGIVERIEYDPNRSSWIALVRWIEGVLRPGKRFALHNKAKNRGEENAKKLFIVGRINENFRFLGRKYAPLSTRRNTVDPMLSIDVVAGSEMRRSLPTFFASLLGQRTCNTREENVFAPRNLFEPTAIIGLLFSFSSLPRKAKSFAPSVLFSAFYYAEVERGAATFGPFGSYYLGLPRVAVAGAKPAFFALRMKGEEKHVSFSPESTKAWRFLKLREENTFSQSEGRRWRRTHSVLWAHRIKRKALSWLNESFWQKRKILFFFEPEHSEERPKAVQSPKDEACKVYHRVPFTYILASDQLEAGKTVLNCDWSKPLTSFNYHQPDHNLIAHTDLRFQDHFVRTANEGLRSHMVEPARGSQTASSRPEQNYAYSGENNYILDLYNQMVGNSVPLANIPIGTWVHNTEWNPGQGAKFTRAAGTFAKILKKLDNTPQCVVQLPSGVDKLIDSRCRATIGIVSNPNHGKRELNKAGRNRWLGRRPIVRGVAMNPVDHPHGGGEGRTKGGRPSVSPWGKPTKGGFKTVVRKRKI
uniref:ribosomal protein L2 n=1 Tax=Lycopodium japonicum TaxID=672196 RepID=UPI0026E249A3|nr:ribosomal protein L2 [Lycopodium japonicum]WJK71458.1 ribosomal protein L2 [Lycopodium japonicum]